jgi:hypothetical protein
MPNQLQNIVADNDPFDIHGYLVNLIAGSAGAGVGAAGGL